MSDIQGWEWARLWQDQVTNESDETQMRSARSWSHMVMRAPVKLTSSESVHQKWVGWSVGLRRRYSPVNFLVQHHVFLRSVFGAAFQQVYHVVVRKVFDGLRLKTSLGTNEVMHL